MKNKNILISVILFGFMANFGGSGVEESTRAPFNLQLSGTSSLDPRGTVLGEKDSSESLEGQVKRLEAANGTLIQTLNNLAINNGRKQMVAANVLRAYREEVREIKAEENRLTQQLKKSESTNNLKDDQIARLQDENEELKVRLETSQGTLDIRVAALENLQQELAVTKQQLQTLEEQSRESSREEEQLRGRVVELEAIGVELQAQIDRSQEEIQVSKATIAQLEQESAAKAQQIEGLQAENQRNIGQLQLFQTEDERKAEQIGQFETQVQGFEEEIQRLQTQVQELKQRLEADEEQTLLLDRVSSIEDLSDLGSNFGASSRGSTANTMSPQPPIPFNLNPERLHEEGSVLREAIRQAGQQPHLENQELDSFKQECFSRGYQKLIEGVNQTGRQSLIQSIQIFYQQDLYQEKINSSLRFLGFLEKLQGNDKNSKIKALLFSRHFLHDPMRGNLPDILGYNQNLQVAGQSFTMNDVVKMFFKSYENCNKYDLSSKKLLMLLNLTDEEFQQFKNIAPFAFQELFNSLKLTDLDMYNIARAKPAVLERRLLGGFLLYSYEEERYKKLDGEILESYIRGKPAFMQSQNLVQILQLFGKIFNSAHKLPIYDQSDYGIKDYRGVLHTDLARAFTLYLSEVNALHQNTEVLNTFLYQLIKG